MKTPSAVYQVDGVSYLYINEKEDFNTADVLYFIF
jgi:hypothetical protein